MERTLTNLLSVSSMTISGASLADGVFTFPAGVFCMINQNLANPVPGHLYYGRVDQKVPPNTSFADGRFEYFAGDADRTLNIVFTAFSEATQDNDWHSYSGIRSFVSLGASSGYGLRSFTVNGSNTVYRRNHMIIDLTAAFGAGKEPTKEWCDANIPFFEGTQTITTHPHPYVGVNGVSRKISGAFVGVNGVARRIIAGYVGVNGAARKIFEDNGIRYKWYKYDIADVWEFKLIRTQIKTTNTTRVGKTIPRSAGRKQETEEPRCRTTRSRPYMRAWSMRSSTGII